MKNGQAKEKTSRLQPICRTSSNDVHATKRRSETTGVQGLGNTFGRAIWPFRIAFECKFSPGAGKPPITIWSQRCLRARPIMKICSKWLWRITLAIKGQMCFSEVYTMPRQRVGEAIVDPTEPTSSISPSATRSTTLVSSSSAGTSIGFAFCFLFLFSHLVLPLPWSQLRYGNGKSSTLCLAVRS